MGGVYPNVLLGIDFLVVVNRCRQLECRVLDVGMIRTYKFYTCTMFTNAPAVSTVLFCGGANVMACSSIGSSAVGWSVF